MIFGEGRGPSRLIEFYPKKTFFFSFLPDPETEKSKTRIEDIRLEKGEEANVLDAAAQV